MQTTLTALGWYFILRAGFPQRRVPYRQILAAYAAGVAMNGFLPANIGTFVMLLMFVALIPGATFPGVLGGMVVQKIFFTVAGTFVYLYLFLSVPGSFELQLGGAARPPGRWRPCSSSAACSLLVPGRAHLLAQAQGPLGEGEAGRRDPRPPARLLPQGRLPSFGAWLAKLGVIAVFLAAYGIPVTFHTVMSVVGGNSLANTVSATPGGVGVNQAVNVASLDDVTDTGDRDRVLARPAARRHGVEHRVRASCSSCGRSAGRAASSSSSSPTPTRRRRSRSRRRSGRRRRRRSGAARMP